jgi:hypothetical protein
MNPRNGIVCNSARGPIAYVAFFQSASNNQWDAEAERRIRLYADRADVAMVVLAVGLGALSTVFISTTRSNNATPEI